MASNAMIRADGQRCYIRVAGVDSVAFIKRMLADPRVKGREPYEMFREFGEQLKSVKAASPKRDLSDQYVFMIEEASKGEKTSGILDVVLCAVLDGYSTSVQRENNAEKMRGIDNEHLRNKGGQIKAQVEKTPPEKRKDFRAKGELLDPKRSKRSEPDGTP